MQYKEKLLKYENVVKGKDELKVAREGKHKWKKVGPIKGRQFSDCSPFSILFS